MKNSSLSSGIVTRAVVNGSSSSLIKTEAIILKFDSSSLVPLQRKEFKDPFAIKIAPAKPSKNVKKRMEILKKLFES